LRKDVLELREHPFATGRSSSLRRTSLWLKPRKKLTERFRCSVWKRQLIYCWPPARRVLASFALSSKGQWRHRHQFFYRRGCGQPREWSARSAALPRNIHRNLSRRAERLDSIRRVRQPAQNCRIAWQHFAATRRGNPHDPPLLLRRSTVTLTSLLNYSTLNRFPHYNSFCSCCS
jgi:hypothetical protein